MSPSFPPASPTAASSTQTGGGSLLLIGASRGLGHAMAAEFVARGWRVTGTVRDREKRTPLHDLADLHPDRVRIETVDICHSDQISALHGRLSACADGLNAPFDMLFVNAGVTNDPQQTVAEVTTEEFTRVMVTNALSPLRVVEGLGDLVVAGGLIGIMSSGQGSVTNNTQGQREVYRASKAALNTLMRSYAARRAADARPLVLMAPGWVRTDMGGPDARLTIADSIPRLVGVLLAKRHRPGLEYLDYRGEIVPW